MIPRSLRALVALGVAGALACQGGARRDPPATTDDAGAIDGPRTRVLGLDDRAPAPAAVPLPREDRARLLEPGVEPRGPLRYRFDAGAERTVEATIAITSRALSDGRWTERVALPDVRQALAIAAEPADAGAPARLRLRALPIAIGDGGGEDGQRLARQQTERWRTLLERRRVTVHVDDRGRVTAIAFADVPGAPVGPTREADPARDELWQYLLAVAVPLPAEPVGVGARWEVVTMLRGPAGATLKQMAEYRLVARDGDTWTIAARVLRHGERQMVAADGLPPGSLAELVGLVREATGTLTVTAADPLPVAGELATELRLHGRFRLPGQPLLESASEDLGTVTFGPP